MEADYALDSFLLLKPRSTGLSCATAHLQVCVSSKVSGDSSLVHHICISFEVLEHSLDNISYGLHRETLDKRNWRSRIMIEG